MIESKTIKYYEWKTLEAELCSRMDIDQKDFCWGHKLWHLAMQAILPEMDECIVQLRKISKADLKFHREWDGPEAVKLLKTWNGIVGELTNDFIWVWVD